MAAAAVPQQPSVCAEAHNPPIHPISSSSIQPSINGDLNNTAVMREILKPERHPEFAYRSLAVPASFDDPVIRSRYRPFILPDDIQRQDWVSRLELATVTELVYNDLRVTGERIKVLVLYGSLRQR
jgi:arsenic resistance protein ArsH